MKNKKRSPQQQQKDDGYRFPQKPPAHVYHFDSRMSYGKHQGYTMSEILKINPGYIIWMHEQGILVSKKLHSEAGRALKQRLADNLRYQRAQMSIYPGNVMPEQCPEVFPEIDLLSIDGEPIVI
jgi:hypothetical protein